MKYTDSIDINNQEGHTSIDLPILDDPALACTLPQYGQVVIQSVYVFASWLAGCFAYFVIFALLITRFEKCNKPERADIRTTPLSVSNPNSIGLFEPPEEDIVYAGIRKSNQLLTCSFAKNNPLQAIIVSLFSIGALLILSCALDVQAAVQISRDIAVKTVNDLAFKSQVDDNIICADARFRPFFAANMYARPEAFRYKTAPQDFMSYSFIVAQESITDCSTLIVYQSTWALIPQ